MSGAAKLVVALAVGLTLAAVPGRAHDFDETRRFVVSVEADRVEVLVAYEVRPGGTADALVARYDANHDGLATTALERLARAQTIGPRLRHGVALETGDGALPLTLSRLEFPAPPDDAGRRGVAAVALYTAPLRRPPVAGSPVRLTFRTRGARGQVTLEVQCAEGYELVREDGSAVGAGTQPRRDPVLGPFTLGPRRALEFSFTRAGEP